MRTRGTRGRRGVKKKVFQEMEIWFGLTSNISLKGEGISTAEYLACYVFDENWLYEHPFCSIDWLP